MMQYGWDEDNLDPLGNTYCDYSKLSDDARQVIIDYAPVIANSNIYKKNVCDVISPVWFHFFKDAGIQVELQGGNYHEESRDSSEYPSLSEHTWLSVEGEIFDPTASQFGNEKHPIQEEFYRVSVSTSEEWFQGIEENDMTIDDYRLENIIKSYGYEEELWREKIKSLELDTPEEEVGISVENSLELDNSRDMTI